MKVDVLLGLQWGDEGKGKIVDVLTPNYEVIARFQGGPNAGHTLEFNNIKHVLHTIPSGIFHKDKINVIGNGVVLDPVIFKKEIEEIRKLRAEKPEINEGELYISRKAHLILPSHRMLDAASEAAKGKNKIGSTLRGIGPTYMDKTGRNGLRVGDIESPEFRQRYEFLKQKHVGLLSHFDFEYNLDEIEKEWFEGVEVMKQFHIVDSEFLINKKIRENASVLAEGAQGTLLDIDFGSYPFVTSSSTVCAGACIGLGVAPNKIGEVLGIFKAYCTRVGSGPFPTELNESTGELLRKNGSEFGATTGRPRRCGWLDLVALKYSIMLNGVTQLIMTKADVLNAFETIRVAVAYNVKYKNADGSVNVVETQHFPFDIELEIEPVYKDFKGWRCDTSTIASEKDFPIELSQYIQFIENETGVPISIVSLGPNRTSTVFR